jgi:nitrogenase molybdenum-iron protein NifN
MAGMGAETVAAVAPANTPVLARVAAEQVKVGDLEELELQCKEKDAEIIISNSHAAALAERLNLPLVRAGFPQYDLLGGYQRVWIGYQGTRQTLFEVANILLNLERGEIHPYRSIYEHPGKSYSRSESSHGVGETSEGTGLRH